MLICPLCEKKVESLHKKSHILPEWFYKGYYDEKHKIIELGFKNTQLRKPQKGIYKSIICKPCEEMTQKYDHYASLILTDRSPKSPEYLSVNRKFFDHTDKHGYSLWSNIKFKKFQKFIFLIMLRAHYAEKQKNKYLLINKHHDKIKEICLNDNHLDDKSYPILVTNFPKDDEYRDNIIMPYKNKLNDHYAITFSGGGYLFFIYVSSHRKPQCVDSLKLKKDGSIYVLHTPFQQSGVYKSSLTSILEIVKKYKKKM